MRKDSTRCILLGGGGHAAMLIECLILEPERWCVRVLLLEPGQCVVVKDVAAETVVMGIPAACYAR